MVRDNKHLSLEYWKKFTSRQCCGSGLFILDPGFWFLSVPDPTTATKEERKNSFCPTFFCSHKYDKIKKLLYKELNTFCPNFCHLALKNMGLGSKIRDLEKPGKGTGSQIRIRNTASGSDCHRHLYIYSHVNRLLPYWLKWVEKILEKIFLIARQ